MWKKYVRQILMVVYSSTLFDCSTHFSVTAFASRQSGTNIPFKTEQKSIVIIYSYLSGYTMCGVMSAGVPLLCFGLQKGPICLALCDAKKIYRVRQRRYCQSGGNSQFSFDIPNIPKRKKSPTHQLCLLFELFSELSPFIKRQSLLCTKQRRRLVREYQT